MTLDQFDALIFYSTLAGSEPTIAAWLQWRGVL